MSIRPARLAPAFAVLALALAACGGSAASPSTSAPTVSAAPSAVPSVDASASAAPSASAAASPATGSADIMVTAVDFGYEGVPATATSGTTLGLVNAGQEVHEMVVVRKLPTTTQTFEELLALPMDQVTGLVQDIGFAFAEPGQTAAGTITLGEPGEYLIVCFIPAGTTSLPSMDPNASAPPSLGTGAPHFTLGMRTELTVTQ